MVSIPRVTARTFIRPMSHARTRPGLFRCQSQSGALTEYVVKFREQLGRRILCEAFAALVGQCLGLPIPPIAVVSLSAPAAAVIPADAFQERPEAGLHFGSLFMTPGFTEVMPGQPLPANVWETMADIFAFDMLIQNPDRTHRAWGGKANLLFDGERFAVIDHELAFSFLGVIGALPQPPWALRELPFVSDHLFYDQLHERGGADLPVYDRFMDRLSALSDTFLSDMEASLPADWLNPSTSSKIAVHLKTVRDNPDRFKRGLLEALA